jgi:hypothetical protein
LISGATRDNIPDPIRDLNPLSLHDQRDCHQLIDDLEDAAELQKQPKRGDEIEDKIQSLAAAASPAAQRAAGADR